MAEFNPYKLEEEKWTPNNVYEILPPNAVSWSDYEFGQGTDNVDQEAANKSLLDGFVDFFKELFGTAGQILGGAVELGGAVLSGFVDGVVSFIGGIANAVGSIFGGGSGESPNLPLFNPIKTNLEAAIQPHRDKIDESWRKTEEILAEQEVLRGQMAESLDEMSDASGRAQEAIERAGIAIGEAEAASAAATEARETLEAYNTALNQRITKEFNSAVGRADTAVKKADTLAGELADFKTQQQREINDAVGKAEQAVADLATLTSKVSEAQTKGETALAAADKAIADSEFISGFADDLIPKDAAGKSTWGSHLEPSNESPAESAFGSERTYIMSFSNAAPEPFIPVKGQEVYRLTLWVKEHPDSSNNGFSFHLRSATDYAGWTHVRMNFGEWQTKEDLPNPHAFISDEGWEKYTIDFRWPESAGPAYVRLNQNAGGKFYVHDVQVRVIAPVDNSVDIAQNKALEAYNLLFAKQDEWNEGAKKAIQANTDAAEALARINGIQVGGRNLLKKSDLNISSNAYLLGKADFGDSVPADGEEITISLKGSLGAGNDRFGFFNSGGHTYIGDAYLSDRDSNGVFKVVTKWRSNGTDTHLNIYAMPKSADTASTVEWIKLERGNQASDWSPAPEDLPTQKQVDDAQSRAIRANTDAIKALRKVALGDSLITFLEPSDQDVLDGKAKYDIPAWTANFLYIDPAKNEAFYNNFPGTTPIWRNTARTKREEFISGSRETVAVNDQVEYKWSVWARCSSPGVRFYLTMMDDKGSQHIIQSGSRVGGNPLRAFLIVKNDTAWVRYEGTFKFVPGTKFARVFKISVDPTYGGSEPAWLWLSDLQIHPNIPDANVVNELQEDAIRKNTKVGSANKQAIEALSDGLNAAIELVAANDEIQLLRGQLGEEEKKRFKLQEQIDALQNEMIPRTIVSGDRVTYDDYVSLDGNTVTAKGNWAGQLVITDTGKTSNGYQTSVTRKSVPDGTTREWSFGYPNGKVLRVDYWVYQGRQRTILLINPGPYITGSSFSNGTWGVLATRKVGKTYGTGKIEWRANLLNADRDTTYRFAIKVNGAWVKNVSWTKIGPLTLLGDGKRTLKFEHEFDLPDDATVEVLGYASGDGGSHQARVSLLQGTLVYVQDTAREAQ